MYGKGKLSFTDEQSGQEIELDVYITEYQTRQEPRGFGYLRYATFEGQSAGEPKINIPLKHLYKEEKR